MNFKALLAQLDDLDDRCAETVAAGIANDVSEWATKNGHAELVREWTPAAQPIQVKRYLAQAIAATNATEADSTTPLTVRQAAERSSISAPTIYALCADGKIPHSRIGTGRGTIRIMPSDLSEFLRQTQQVEVDYLN